MPLTPYIIKYLILYNRSDIKLSRGLRQFLPIIGSPVRSVWARLFTLVWCKLLIFCSRTSICAIQQSHSPFTLYDLILGKTQQDSCFLVLCDDMVMTLMIINVGKIILERLFHLKRPDIFPFVFPVSIHQSNSSFTLQIYIFGTTQYIVCWLLFRVDKSLGTYRISSKDKVVNIGFFGQAEKS